MKKTGAKTTQDVIDDFYQFCINLQDNPKYKESVLFATLFFYYLEKKKQQKSQ